MSPGLFTTRAKLTARLYFQRIGAPFVDLGNILLVKQDPKIDRSSQTTARRGFHQVTHEEPAKIDPRWTFKLDEQLGPQLQLLHLATETDNDQAASGDFGLDEIFLGSGAAPVTYKAGTSLFLGFYNVHTLSALWDPDTENTLLVEGIDFRLDAPAGMFTFLRDISVQQFIYIYFEHEAAAIAEYKLLSDSFVCGTAMLVLTDQNDPSPRHKITFDAEIRAQDWGDNDGQKNNEFQLELLALTPPTVLSRE